MKWLLRGIFLILLLFAGLCTVGFFLPATQEIERSITAEAYPEEVFVFLNDLKLYSQWSPLHDQLREAQTVYGGAESGIGQTLAWQGGTQRLPFGSQEIIQSQPGEFVQVKINLAGRDATATHAILPQENGDGVTVLIKSEIALGGFPYLERVAARLQQANREQEFDAALVRLKTISENYAAQ